MPTTRILTLDEIVVAVVSRAGPHAKIPEWEQVLSAGAAAMSLVLAAHALGFGANWITEWYAYDRGVLDALGLASHELISLLSVEIPSSCSSIPCSAHLKGAR